MKKLKKIHIKEALQELQDMIKKKYPDATFSVERGGDNHDYYLNVFTELDNDEVILDLVMDRLIELTVDEKLPLHVLPLPTPEKNIRMWKHYFSEHPELTSRFPRILPTS